MPVPGEMQEAELAAQHSAAQALWRTAAHRARPEKTSPPKPRKPEMRTSALSWPDLAAELPGHALGYFVKSFREPDVPRFAEYQTCAPLRATASLPAAKKGRAVRRPPSTVERCRVWGPLPPVRLSYRTAGDGLRLDGSGAIPSSSAFALASESLPLACACRDESARSSLASDRRSARSRC